MDCYICDCEHFGMSSCKRGSKKYNCFEPITSRKFTATNGVGMTFKCDACNLGPCELKTGYSEWQDRDIYHMVCPFGGVADFVKVEKED